MQILTSVVSSGDFSGIGWWIGYEEKFDHSEFCEWAGIESINDETLQSITNQSNSLQPGQILLIDVVG